MSCSAANRTVEQQLDVLYGSPFRIGAYTIGYTRDIACVSVQWRAAGKEAEH
jgi:hypothetical protein